MIYPLAARRGMITPLARGIQRADTSWWLAGGISAENCAAAYQAKGAASYVASKVNLANPGTYNAVEVAAPSWDIASGWDATAGGKLLLSNCGFKFGNNYSMAVRFSDSPNTDIRAVVGYRDITTAGIYHMDPGYYGQNDHQFSNQGISLVTGNYLPSGVMGMAGQRCFANGVYEGALAILVAAEINQIGICNCTYGTSGDSTGNIYKDSVSKIQAVVIYNTVITDEQMIAVQVAMAAI